MSDFEPVREINSQKEMILAALERGERLTPKDARKRFGADRLAARVWDLKQMGYDIRKSRKQVAIGVYVAQYYLHVEQPIEQFTELALGV